MGQTEVGFIGIAVLMVLLFMGVHIGFTLVIMDFLGYAAIVRIGLISLEPPAIHRWL